MYVCMYVCMYVNMCVYIYTYRERERERERCTYVLPIPAKCAELSADHRNHDRGRAS